MAQPFCRPIPFLLVNFVENFGSNGEAITVAFGVDAVSLCRYANGDYAFRAIGSLSATPTLRPPFRPLVFSSAPSGP